jgi:hypothetical protein
MYSWPTFMTARGKPEAKLRLYVGGNIEAMLDVALLPLLHAGISAATIIATKEKTGANIHVYY